MNEIVKASKRQQEDSNPGSLDWESDVLTTAPPPNIYMYLLKTTRSVTDRLVVVYQLERPLPR